MFARWKKETHVPKCGGFLRVGRGLELGHIFLLGTRYSEPMKALIKDRFGQEKPVVMGCYGIGISRCLSAIVEQYHDEKGIKFPTVVAPFELNIICVNTSDETQRSVAGRALYQGYGDGLGCYL
jgi:prolyl-tRNA synthetase